ncbi:hypothetical protein [Tepidibacter hydrothermalis]|uniref:Uncharacterized protein n=1 Tax=Tepidibacter hydrothermalis TaxID=3036126 RepID=A0ABY8E9V2_9FIRM|nr:hypothetical protein [Tepidibacter hydrothermalis]WFD08710.1 hypothetical protein P4S50_09895 [Tepidibacter hydrothermalis]
MKNWKKNLLICLSIITITLFIIFTFFIFTSLLDRLNQRDYQDFANIGKQLFTLNDKGYITVGESIGSYDYEDKPKLEKALLKYKSKILVVDFVDKNVILLSFGSLFQSVEGIVITRNNAELKDTYEGTGFDEGTLRYTELIPTVYRFSAGL